MKINANTHTLRDNWGQFATEIDHATAAAMRKLSAEGERLAAAMAPPAIKHTFSHHPIGRLAWAWGSDHQWAEGLDQGIPPHLIGRPGQYLYGKAGERHRDHTFSATGPVLHPGVEGSHFMERSLDAVAHDLMPTLREEVSRAVRGA